jgi:hypothetical protein
MHIHRSWTPHSALPVQKLAAATGRMLEHRHTNAHTQTHTHTHTHTHAHTRTHALSLSLSLTGHGLHIQLCNQGDLQQLLEE